MAKYSGKLELIGTGQTRNGNTVRSVIRIGEEQIKKIIISDYLESFMSLGEGMTLSVGKFFLRNWLLAVRDEKELYRTGIVAFIFLNILSLFGGLFASFIVIIFSIQIHVILGFSLGGVIVLYSIYLFISNLKTYFTA